MSQPTLIVHGPRMLLVGNRHALHDHLLERLAEGWRDVVVSLAGTTCVDSSGLGTLVALKRAVAARKGTRLRLAGLSDDLRQLFGATRLDGYFEIADAAEGEIDPWRAPEEEGVPVPALPAFSH